MSDDTSEFTLKDLMLIPTPQVDLLVNVLQSLVPDLPLYLFNCVVSDLQREPRWSDMALPRGMHYTLALPAMRTP